MHKVVKVVRRPKVNENPHTHVEPLEETLESLYQVVAYEKPFFVSIITFGFYMR